jgi:hypothetical protein
MPKNFWFDAFSSREPGSTSLENAIPRLFFAGNAGRTFRDLPNSELKPRG